MNTIADKTMNTSTREPGTDVLGRRRHRRLGWDREIKLAWLRSDGTLGPWNRVTGDDVSLGGMSITAAIEFRKGSAGVVEMPLGDGRNATVGVRVVHSERVGPTTESAGLEFVALTARGAGVAAR